MSDGSYTSLVVSVRNLTISVTSFLPELILAANSKRARFTVTNHSEEEIFLYCISSAEQNDITPEVTFTGFLGSVPPSLQSTPDSGFFIAPSPWQDDLWKGPVYASSVSGNAVITVMEFT